MTHSSPRSSTIFSNSGGRRRISRRAHRVHDHSSTPRSSVLVRVISCGVGNRTPIRSPVLGTQPCLPSRPASNNAPRRPAPPPPVRGRQRSGGPMYLPPGGGLCIRGHPDHPAPERGPARGTARTAAHNGGNTMPLQSGSLQTPVTDFAVAGILDGQVTAMDVLDPTENNEKTSLLEVDDEFDVKLTWKLTGAATPVVGGSWVVSLYSDDMDGIGTMTGLIAGPAVVPITGGVSPLPFEHTFKVAPPKVKEGLYKLTATISHSPTGDPAKLSEMFGYAEATPIDIRRTVVE